MWRKLIAVGLVFLGGTASAEQTLDEALQNMAVFDCSAGGESTLYVFRTSLDGKTSLIDDDSVPVRREDGKYSVITAEGAREISTEAYFVYQDGEAISGSCYDATSTAQKIFPTLMDGFLLSSPQGIAEAEVAAILIRDMQVKTDIEIARVTAEAELAQAALVAELDAANDRYAAAQTELATANQQIPALFETADALGNTLAETKEELASLTKAFDKNLLDLASERASSQKLRDRIVQLEGELAEALVAMAQESAVSTLKDSALENATARIETLTAELDTVTQERRSLAANVATLNQKTSDLAGKLNSAVEAETKAADLVTEVQTLTDVAISRIATLQDRGASDVQAELCSLIASGSRPARCGN